jgi:hypothetical protein
MTDQSPLAAAERLEQELRSAVEYFRLDQGCEIPRGLCTFRGHVDRVEQAADTLAVLRAALGQAEKALIAKHDALRTFGQHPRVCKAWKVHPLGTLLEVRDCSCGLWKALHPPEAALRSPRARAEGVDDDTR